MLHDDMHSGAGSNGIVEGVGGPGRNVEGGLAGAATGGALGGARAGGMGGQVSVQLMC